MRRAKRPVKTMAKENNRRNARPTWRMGLLGLSAVAAVLVLLLSGFLGAAPQSLTGGAVSMRDSAGTMGKASLAVNPAVTPATQLYINRSQSSGTYVPEYIAYNNSTTLTRIPTSLTGVNGCRWVTVENLTVAISGTAFHNVKYGNRSTANNSGTFKGAQTSFDLCTGNAIWLNYVYWTYTVYDLNAATLGNPANATVTFGKYPGTTIVPTALSLKFGASNALALTLPSNVSLAIAFPLFSNASATCDVTGQVCSFTSYQFVSAAATESSSGTTITNTTGTIQFGTIGSVTGEAEVSAQWVNITAGYKSTQVQANTATGAFFADVENFWANWVVFYWYLWVLVIIGAIAAVAVFAGRHSRRRAL